MFNCSKGRSNGLPLGASFMLSKSHLLPTVEEHAKMKCSLCISDGNADVFYVLHKAIYFPCNQSSEKVYV